MFGALLADLRAVISGHAEEVGEQRIHVETALTKIDRLEPEVTFESTTLPVVDQHLPGALARSDGPLARSLAEAWPHLHWRIARYEGSDDPDIVRMRSHYAFSCLVAPGGDFFPPSPFVSRELSVGFALQGPQVHYPLHSHPAVELYGTISGTGQWKRGDSDWAPRPPGSIMIHESYEPHATRTADEPAVMWYAWISDLETLPALD